jgi:putative ABC transport system permease protein
MKWTFAFRNLFRNARRSVATGVAILVGFMGLVLLGGFILRVENTLRTQAVYLKAKGHIVIYKTDGMRKFATRPAKYVLSPDEIARIRQELDPQNAAIDWIGLNLTGVGLLSNGVKSAPFALTAVDAESYGRIQDSERVREWAGDLTTEEDRQYAKMVKENPSAVSATERLGAFLSLSAPFSALTEEQRSLQMAGLSYFGDLNAVNADLVASHSTGSEFNENSSLLGSLALAQDLYQTEGVENLSVYLKDGSQTAKIHQQISERFRELGLPFEAYPFDHQDISPNYVGAMGFLLVMSGFFVFLICGAVILSVINSLTMGILERSREIGTLRALGFRRGQISWMLTQESLCLTTFSCLAGAVLSLIVSIGVNGMNFRFSPPGAPKSTQLLLVPEWDIYLFSYALFLALSCVASYVLSYWKMKSKIVELLSDSKA